MKHTPADNGRTRIGDDVAGHLWTELDRRTVDTARVLAADAVQKVGNGHPGTAISLAPVAHLLFQRYINHNPSDTTWAGRDRFVLSCGHSSLTLYNQLFLTGAGLELDDLKALRTWESKTPGHPEYGHTAGVEMTTGPLGQGLASAVGMAMAARRERGLFDPQTPEGDSPFDHTIWVVASDGDVQEGVTAEASSLAGHQELGNLVVIYDDNKISIEDDTDIAFTEDVLARYAAYGWHTQRVDWTDGGEYYEDLNALSGALDAAVAETSKPSIIALRTIIGWPSPTKQNTGGIHGSALGDDELVGLKKAIGFDPDQAFQVDDDVLAYAREATTRGQHAQSVWDEKFATWEQHNPDNAALYRRLMNRELPPGWADSLPTFESGSSVATRSASGSVLSALADVLPELWGGSADLAGSNNTTMKGAESFVPAAKATDAFPGNEYGRTLHFGIREHAMGAIINGILLHGPTRAYGGTFLVFSDYMRPSVRLAALMNLPAIYVWTHDSIGLGEDGPTHQPIEHLASLRAIPNLDVVRPADAHETAAAWRAVIANTDNPSALCLTRQGVPVLDGIDHTLVARGGYVLSKESGETPDVLLLATGSEVQLALSAQEQLAHDNVSARVISMPCLEWFTAQPQAYRDDVLPPNVRARVVIEAGVRQGWHQFAGDAGEFVTIEHFGASAGANELFERFGFTTASVVEAAQSTIAAAQ